MNPDILNRIFLLCKSRLKHRSASMPTPSRMTPRQPAANFVGVSSVQLENRRITQASRGFPLAVNPCMNMSVPGGRQNCWAVSFSQPVQWQLGSMLTQSSVLLRVQQAKPSLLTHWELVVQLAGTARQFIQQNSSPVSHSARFTRAQAVAAWPNDESSELKNC